MTQYLLYSFFTELTLASDAAMQEKYTTRNQAVLQWLTHH
jgi:hypothetical protein